MRLRLRSSSTVLFVCAAKLCAQEYVIVPGERVGPVYKDSTKESLRTQLSAGELTDGDLNDAEGEPRPGTFLFKSDPTRTLAIAFGESGRPDVVSICPAIKQGCKWRTTEGLTVGVTLKTLVGMNGAEVTFSGFGWDYDGFVISWNGGKLRHYKDCAGLYVRLGTDADSIPRSVSGEKPVSSQAPALRNLNVQVRYMALTFPMPQCVAATSK